MSLAEKPSAFVRRPALLPSLEAEFAACRILVSDDEAPVVELVTKVLARRFGCAVDIAANGEELLAKLAQTPVDVVVMDMRMPGLHGIDLLRRVRTEFPATSVIVITGHPHQFPYLDAIQAGASDFLNKPFPTGELEAKTLRLLHERKVARERERAESKYRSLFEMSAEGMVLLDGDTHAIMDANRAFCALSGYDAEALFGRDIKSYFGPADRMRLEQWLQFCARTGRGTMADLAVLHPSGKAVHADLSASFINGEFDRFVFLTFKDITEKREVDRRLADAAQRDELTGLYNKRSFNSRLEAAIAAAQGPGQPFALFLIDLDNFKKCNDTHGHQIGDKLLISVGRAIAKSIRAASADAGFRCGGDEFAVLIHGAGREGCHAIAERIMQEFGASESYGTTMSIGIALFENDADANAIVKRADDALYRAKGAGKNTFVIA
jgi:diguanylate cyclase (GGDEF)-like protein/PAS domain S-box-containing protein